jgi:hypothetical protein
MAQSLEKLTIDEYCTLRSKTDRRLVVRHCGHPTALRPYYIVFDGFERVHDLGTFRQLHEAQLRAEQIGDATPR